MKEEDTRESLVGKFIVRSQLSVEQTWQLVIDLSAQQHWLGSGAHLRPIEGTRVQLYHEAGLWRCGTVMTVLPNDKITCCLVPATWWPDAQNTTRFTISFESHPKGGCKVTVEETDLLLDQGEPSPYDDAFAFWREALLRLKRLAGQINSRKNNPRQAVIVIHGIGEQQPGVTLKNFVEGVVSLQDSEVQSWLKPDRTSRLFELRRITLKASKYQARPTTDVFELYWAHVIQDTTLSQVASWFKCLLLRRSVPSRFLPVWVFGWVGIAAVVLFSVAHVAGWWPDWTKYVLSGGIIFLVATVFWRLLGKSFVINSIGDAARYLTPRPANIEHRQAIREAGVDLLETLHSQGKFDRIVIVGHSLGSVIAYDIITHYWIRTHRDHLRLPKVSNTGTTAVERGIDETDIEKAQTLQHNSWKVARSNSQPWLITDLVTLGSPLSAASFLLAPTEAEFQRAKENRELPTCPPVLEVKGEHRCISFGMAFDDRFGGKDKHLCCCHHAAPFAVTRWTNLHFENSLLKDPVGGPVAPQLGAWIRDIKLPHPKGRPFFLHTCYWSRKGDDSHVKAVLDVLQLDSGKELLEELKKHSPLMYLPDL